MKTTTIKPKACKVCRTSFTPARPMASCCSPMCALDLARSKREKAEKQAQAVDRRETRAKRERLKTRGDWIKDAQTVFNKYCRLRDAQDGCISCDRPSTWDGQWHASHFRSVGASTATRFNLWNVHKSCSICNNYLSGNLSEYEPRLRAKIGQEKVDILRSLNHTSKYSIEYLRRLRDVFARKVRRLERRMERHSGV